ncbi:MAG: hypothetical protein H0W66_01265 [Chthoniobacterales bacterium]|nr:hypothetical protein [Chthoniobacterales bacterium]
MILKPRIAISVSVIFAGAFFAFVGFGSAIAMASLYSLFPAGLGVLGLLFFAGGLAALWNRKHLTITIDPSGITMPTGTVFRPGRTVHIPRAAMATIARDESVRGRLVVVALRTGGKVPIQARHYCDLRTFLSHCKAQGLPTS